MSNLQLKKVNFLLIIEEKPPTPDFSLKNLPAASKIDVVARVILSIFPKYTQSIEPSLDVLFTHDEPHLLQINGLRNSINQHDEISIAAEIRELIKNNIPTINKVNSTDLQAQWLSIDNLESYLETAKTNFECIYYLHETGYSINEILTQILECDRVMFILGGRHDISKENEKILLNFGIKKINLGEKSYLASSCITKIIISLEKKLPL